jgi:plastocyanin
MKPLNSRLFSAIICGGLPLAGLLVPQPVHAATWQAAAGVQSDDMARQGLAFLPNELWIHAGDNITWTFPSDEIHTVSFLTFSQLRPVGPHRNDVITPDVPIPGFDGSSYVNSGDQCAAPATCPPAVSNTYTVNFPTAGNFKLVCLVHLYMNGTIHVLSPTAALPHDQAFYDRQATAQSEQLLEALKDQAKELGHRGDDEQEHAPADQVIAGPGEIVATGAGSHESPHF